MKNDLNIHIDTKKCIQCRLCSIECPADTSGVDEIRSDQNSPRCDRCFHCYAICPQNAIQIRGIREELLPVGQPIKYADLLMLYKKRRSMRKFDQKPVPHNLQKHLTDAARFSPTGGNVQDLTITIINSLETRKQLEAAIVAYYDKIIRMLRIPALRYGLRFSGDAKVRETAKDTNFFAKIERIYIQMKDGRNNIFYDAPLVMLFHTERLLPTAHEDCILAAYNVVLAAETLNMGSCFVSLSQQAISADRRIRRVIGIPRSDIVHAVLVLGFPATSYRRVAPRKEKNIQFR